jgi:hypothetical protein
MPGSRVTDS